MKNGYIALSEPEIKINNVTLVKEGSERYWIGFAGRRALNTYIQ
jgi:hypothetical protein